MRGQNASLVAKERNANNRAPKMPTDFSTARRMRVGVDSVEKCRKDLWGNCPAQTFSEFDSFELVMESDKAQDMSPVMLPGSRCRLSAESDASAMNGSVRADSLDGDVFDAVSMPVSPVIESLSGDAELQPSVFVHTSSPRRDSGFDADQSGSTSASSSRLSGSGLSPFADISAISGIDELPSALASIDENNVSDFSHQRGRRKQHRPKDANGLVDSAAKGKKASNNSHSLHPENSLLQEKDATVDVIVRQELAHMAELTEQLARMTASNDTNTVPQSVVTPKQYVTRQVASSRRDAASRKALASPVRLCEPPFLNRMITRSVAKARRAQLTHSYNASQ